MQTRMHCEKVATKKCLGGLQLCTVISQTTEPSFLIMFAEINLLEV